MFPSLPHAFLRVRGEGWFFVSSPFYYFPPMSFVWLFFSSHLCPPLYSWCPSIDAVKPVCLRLLLTPFSPPSFPIMLICLLWYMILPHSSLNMPGHLKPLSANFLVTHILFYSFIVASTAVVTNAPCKSLFSTALFIWSYRLESVQSLRSSTHVHLGLPLPRLPCSFPSIVASWVS